MGRGASRAHDGTARQGLLESAIENVSIAIWVAVGGIIGWIACTVSKPETYMVFMENMAVAMFGSFLGGEFVTTQFTTGPKVPGFTMTGLGFAVACSIGMLLLLRLMRRSVGPMRSGKPKSRH